MCIYAMKLNTLKPGKSIEIIDLKTPTYTCRDCIQLLKNSKVFAGNSGDIIVLTQSPDAMKSLLEYRSILEKVS